MKMKLLLLLLLVAGLGTAQSTEVEVIRVPDSGIQPQAMCDANGNLHLVYFKGDASAGDLFYVERKSGKNEFSSPIRVNRDDSTAIAMGTIRGAQMALGKNSRVHVAWMGGANTAQEVPGHSYKEHPMFYTHLNDAGTAFDEPRNVITRTGGLDGGGSVAADNEGNVYVAWHGREAGAVDGEAGRAVYVARSADGGKTFAPEMRANSDPTGACGCCRMQAFADQQGRLFLLYRAANPVSRDMMLLTSLNQGKTFTGEKVSSWITQSCPMSSSALVENSNQLLVATESTGHAEWVEQNIVTGELSKRVPLTAVPSKHPAITTNAKGEILAAWAEGAGWAKGGTVHWQLFDSEGKQEGAKAGGATLPAWSFPAVVCADGTNFTVIY